MKRNVPKLRFKGFSDEWESKRLGDFIEERSEKTEDKENYPLYSLTIENGVVPKSDRYEREFLVKKEGNFKIVQPNDFVYNPMNLRFGALAVYKGKIPVSVSGYYNVFNFNGESVSQFWSNYLKTDRMFYLYNTIATGSLEEKKRVHYSQFKELNLNMPKKEEQEKISNFLTKVDKIIEKQEEKVTELEKYKKGMMQKIFSQEIRFKDENGGEYPEWEKKHLGNLVERVVRKNKGNVTKRPLTISAQYGLVDQEEFFNKVVASANLEGYYLLNKGEFAYNKSYSNGYPFGAIKRLDRYENGAVSTLYICFIPKEDVDSNYLVQYFESDMWHKEVSMIAVEGARNHGLLNISVTDFFETIHRIPCLEEQSKIANFLSKIDLVVEKEKEMLEELRKWKKGLLQQMFV